MLVGGKAWDIAAVDLIALADKFDVRQPEALLKRVADAVARWPEFARMTGVPKEETARIASYHPVWVKGGPGAG